jgi:hypothetical protein
MGVNSAVNTNTDGGSVSATPIVPENLYGYLGENGRIQQVKIATSNLFIETQNVPIDYMTGAIFDGIGGNEFINTSGTDTILQESNSIISDSSDVRGDVSSKKNEKQADGTEATMGKFALKLANYLPTTVSNSQYIGSTNVTNATTRENTAINEFYPARNVYFDSTYAYILVELDNLGENEQVEVEFVTSDNPTSAII